MNWNALPSLLAQARVQQAVRLLRAAEAQREKLNVPMTAQEHAEYDREVAVLRTQLDEPTRKAAWAEGRAITMD